MAVLQKIRNRAGVLIIIFVGVALFLFIVDPSTFEGLFNKQETDIAEINGESIPYNMYQRKVEQEIEFTKTAQRVSTVDEETRENIRERVWNNLFNKYLLAETFEELGITVGEDELNNMLWGSEIHPFIKQNFGDQQAGTIDTMRVEQFFAQADQRRETKLIADYFKRTIKRDKLNEKFQTLVQKGFYTPTPLAELKYKEENRKVDFIYLAKMYKNVQDDEVSYEEKDLRNYYKEHKYKFKNEASTRDIDYVTFNVIPSSEDSASLMKQMKDIKKKFSLTEDEQAFVNMHSDNITRKMFYKQEEVPGNLGEKLFEEKDTTFVSDIIETDSSYIVFKALKFETVPDSVKARHILIPPDSTTTLEMANNMIDSLETEINEGAEFSMLARNFSRGPSAQSDGDLGWFQPGTMVKPFNDACFYGEEGDITKVETQHGVHLVWVEKQSEKHPMVKLAVVNKEISHSDNTYDKYYADASRFREDANTSEKFKKAIVEKNLVKKIATDIKDSDKEIAGLDNAREIVKWSFDAEKGEVSKVFVVGNDKFVVARVTSVKNEGIADFEQVKDQIIPIVIKKKKADGFIKDLKPYVKKNANFTSAASQAGALADTAKNISFSSFSVPALGVEPKLIGKTSYSEEGDVGGPIEGNKGVYVYKIVNVIEAPETEEYSQQRMKERSTYMQRVAYELMDAIEKASDIEDNRSEFF